MTTPCTEDYRFDGAKDVYCGTSSAAVLLTIAAGEQQWTGLGRCGV